MSRNAVFSFQRPMGPIPATCGAPAEVTTWMRLMKPWKLRSLVMPSRTSSHWISPRRAKHQRGFITQKQSPDIEKFSLKPPWFLDSIRSLHWVSEWVFHGLLVKSFVFLGRFTTVASGLFMLHQGTRSFPAQLARDLQGWGTPTPRRGGTSTATTFECFGEIGIETAHGGFPEWGYPHSWIVYNGKSMKILQRSMIWGSPI